MSQFINAQNQIVTVTTVDVEKHEVIFTMNDKKRVQSLKSFFEEFIPMANM